MRKTNYSELNVIAKAFVALLGLFICSLISTCLEIRVPIFETPLIDVSQAAEKKQPNSSEITPAVQTAHQWWLMALSVSPVGNLIASGDIDGLVKISRVPDLTVLHNLPAHQKRVTDLVFSPDGKYLYTGGEDHVVKIWDMKTKNLLQSMNMPECKVASMALSPDGKKLAVVCDKSRFFIWRVPKGKLLRKREGDSYNFDKVIFDRSGKHLIFAKKGRGMDIWELVGARTVKHLKFDYRNMESIALSPKGDLLIGGDNDSKIQIWSYPEGKIKNPEFAKESRRSIPADIDYNFRGSIAIHPKGHQAAYNCYPKNICIVDLQSAKVIRKAGAHDEEIEDIVYSFDGKYLITGDLHGVVRVWETDNLRQKAVLEEKPNQTFRMAFSDDFSQMALGGTSIKVLNLHSSPNTQLLRSHYETLMSMDFSPDGKKLVTGSEDKRVRVWSIRRGRVRRMLMGHQKQICEVAFHPNGKSVVSIAKDGSIRFWDVTKGQQTKLIKGKFDQDCTLKYHPDGRLLYSENNVLNLRGAKPPHKNLKLSLHSKPVTSSTLTRNGKYIASVDKDLQVRVYDLSRKKIHRQFQADGGRIYNLTLTPDGNILAGTNGKKQVVVWDTKSGKKLATFGEYRNAHFADLMFSPDGKTLIFGNEGAVLMWKTKDWANSAQMFNFNDNSWLFVHHNRFDGTKQGFKHLRLVKNNQVVDFEKHRSYIHRPGLLKAFFEQ